MTPTPNVRVVADSIARNGKRITTLVVILWRMLLAEFNTHRMLSRSSASSRAIPNAKLIERVLTNPFIPRHWGKNQAGMRAGKPMDAATAERCTVAWLTDLEVTARSVQWYADQGVHKSIPNRLIEPWMLTEIVVTATEWENFFALRTELAEDGVTPLAEHHFYDAAEEMLAALNASEPRSLEDWQWHLPFLTPEEWASIDWAEDTNRPYWSKDIDRWIKRSAARAGRVSYLKHDGTSATWEEDFKRAEEFITMGHCGPLEHQARPATDLDVDGLYRTYPAEFRSGNLIGWVQLRKTLPNENRTFSRLLKKTWIKPGRVLR